MSVTDQLIVGQPMPRLASVAPAGGLSLAVTWAEGPRAGIAETVDLAPDIMTYRFYRPLRDDVDLFASVRVDDDGAAVVWGDETIDMPATAIERLAESAMVAEDFSAFLKRNDLTFDGAAAQLGISRRLVAYYAGGRPIPRYIKLATERLDQIRSAPERESTSVRSSSWFGSILDAGTSYSEAATVGLNLSRRVRLIEAQDEHLSTQRKQKSLTGSYLQ